MLPILRRVLIEWKLKSPNTSPSDLVICTADGKPVQERNLRRAFDGAKAAAKIDVGDARLSWHALRHSYASMMATTLAVEPTTLARVTGHNDPGFTYRKYARDARPDAVVVADVLDRAKRAGVGG
jgi:integrase